jgi:hypothetical protein
MKTRTDEIPHSPKWLLALTVISLIAFCSCNVVIRNGGPISESSREPESRKELKPLGIPPGHLPPPGACRIWIPGTPPGHQSPSGNCAGLRERVPAGAWLLHRESDNPDEIEVSEYDEKRPSVVVIIRYFEASTGRYLRDAPY